MSQPKAVAEKYPDFDIDVEKEQMLLVQHQYVIWQHPFFWYSGPSSSFDH
jgi:glutathione-regulated potassium-efflux system ancillary protein KefG